MYKRGLVVIAAFLILMTGCRSTRNRVLRYYQPVPPTSTASSPARSAASTVPTSQFTGAPSGRVSRATTVTTPVQQAITTAPPATAPSPQNVASPDSNRTEDVPGAYRLKVGDPIVIYLRGVPGAPGGEQQIEGLVGEDGCIQLPYISDVKVLNMTATEAQEVIRETYLNQRIYKQITVNVVVPSRSYFIRGEVRHPGRYQLVGTITVLQAIAAAGGYTEFASRSVEVFRGDRRIELNMRQIEKRPELDRVIEPGDIVVVNRSIF